MLRNRSVPTETVLPHLTYQNVADALASLTATFGFAEHYRYGEEDGSISGAQMHLGEAWIMLRSARAGEVHETAYGERQYGVEDLEGHHWLFSKHVRA